MATGWAHEGAVQEQIDASVKDAIERARSRLPQSGSDAVAPTHCVECHADIPEARRAAMPGVSLCLACQEQADQQQRQFTGYNRRGSKDSQLR
jgi:phage/conjugal plasmid C-4 type zinc finger TraR family protein